MWVKEVDKALKLSLVRPLQAASITGKDTSEWWDPEELKTAAQRAGRRQSPSQVPGHWGGSLWDACEAWATGSRGQRGRGHAGMPWSVGGTKELCVAVWLAGGHMSSPSSVPRR